MNLLVLLMSAKKLLRFEKEEIVEHKSSQEVFNFAKLKDNINIQVVSNT